jgi:hypothetical protein
VLSAINSPSYVIQHSSGYKIDGNGKMEHGTVTGISLLVCLIHLGFYYSTFKINYFDTLSWAKSNCPGPWLSGPQETLINVDLRVDLVIAKLLEIHKIKILTHAKAIHAKTKDQKDAIRSKFRRL